MSEQPKQVIAIADVPVTWWTRLKDWLLYRPWTADQLAERVARSVANTRYLSWHKPEEHQGGPVTGRIYHSFAELTAEEKAAGVPDGDDIVLRRERDSL